MVRGRRLVSAVLATDMTDDTGAFRLHSVPEGDYYVTARFLSMISALSGATTLANLPIGSAVYYPGTPSMADAQRIPLGSGEDRGGIVFPLVATTSVRISGTLVDAAGAGVDGGSVELHDAADFSVVARSYGNFGETFDGGRFTMINVTPGSYVLVGTVTRPSGPETAYQPVTVGTSDMSGITLAAARGVTISGSVAAASGAPLPASIMITARSMSGAAPASDSVERGAFTLNGIVGPYALGVEGLAAGWAVQSFDINGIDVADGVINFPPSGQLTAQIVLTNRLTELTGTVRSEQGPVADADVVIFPENPAKWPYPSRLVRVARGDAAGRYRVTGLPPARYLAIALDYLDEDEYQDPDVLARLRGRATSFALGEAAKASVDLMMVRR
jgi:hypothetical protein